VHALSQRPVEQRGVGTLREERLAEVGGRLRAVEVLGAFRGVAQQTLGADQAENDRVGCKTLPLNCT